MTRNEGTAFAECQIAGYPATAKVTSSDLPQDASIARLMFYVDTAYAERFVRILTQYSGLILQPPAIAYEREKDRSHLKFLPFSGLLINLRSDGEGAAKTHANAHVEYLHRRLSNIPTRTRLHPPKKSLP